MSHSVVKTQKFKNGFTLINRRTVNVNQGFTLIELILVVAVVSLVAAISSPFYSRFLLQNSVDNTTNQIMGELRKAQIYAMMGKSNSGWSVDFGGTANTITLYQGTTAFASRPNPAVDETFSVNSNVSVAGLTTVNFAKATGIPTPSSGVTITVSSGNNSRTITVNTQGVTTQ